MAATAIKGRKPRSCSMCKKEMTSNKALERNASRTSPQHKRLIWQRTFYLNIFTGTMFIP
jgi:hypothetical protein